MEIISTTATAAEKLKRLAKTLRKTTDTSLAIALDAVAKQHGYEHWRHVTVCLEQTRSLNLSKPLPDSLKALLDQAATRNPASAESQKAFAHGFVFALDVKDAAEISLTSEYTECGDAWYLGVKDVWRGLVHYRDEETGRTLIETQSSEDLISTALDDLQNYRFFRYLGPITPTSLEEAYGQIRQLSFFPPTHIWLGGKFIDIGETAEIRVDGKVVHSLSSGFNVRPSDDKRTRFERLGHLLNATERALFDKMTAVEQDTVMLQLEKQTPAGQAHYKQVQSSPTSSWKNAKEI